MEYGRVDMFKVNSGVRVMKWAADWIPGVPAVVNYVNVEIPMQDMVDYLRSQDDWIVRTFPGGARAWYKNIRPIRTRSQIIRKRERVTRNKCLYPGIQLHALDFALDM